MLIVALTGGIATGKSLAADVLRQLGCFVESADRIAHSLMRPGTPVWTALKERFGPGILSPDGHIDRKKLGDIVFADDDLRRDLNRLIHPQVQKIKERTIKELRKSETARIYVSEAALTIEAGYAGRYDKVILVSCPVETQIRRLRLRDRLSEEDALKRIRSQMPDAEKRTFADYIIDSSGPIESTIEQTERVFRHLMRDEALKTGFKRSKRRPGGESSVRGDR